MPDKTAIFQFQSPKSTEAPAGPEQLKNLATEIETRLAEIELLLGTPAKAAEPEPGDLVIVNGTSDPRYIAATGDVTFNSSGVATLGKEKVTLEKLKAELGLTDAYVAAANKDGAAGTASMRTLGTGAAQAAAGNDARLSDERTPKANSVNSSKIENGSVADADLAKMPFAGDIASTGEVLEGTGIKEASRSGTGVYLITFSTPQPTKIMAVANIVGAVGIVEANNVAGEAAKEKIEVKTYTTAGALADRRFRFIARAV